MWATSFPEIPYFPAKDLHIALYFISLVQSGVSYCSIQQFFYSLNFFHNACGVDNPCKTSFLLCILEGCKRLATKPVRSNRQPILPEHIVKLVARFGGSSASLADIRDVCFCLVAFAGFLRYDELSRLKWTDISMFDDHMSVFIGKSKTDQLGKGCIRVIAKTGNPSCPCAMLIRYANMAHREFTSDEFIFQRLGYSKNPWLLPPSWKKFILF